MIVVINEQWTSEGQMKLFVRRNRQNRRFLWATCLHLFWIDRGSVYNTCWLLPPRSKAPWLIIIRSITEFCSSWDTWIRSTKNSFRNFRKVFNFAWSAHLGLKKSKQIDNIRQPYSGSSDSWVAVPHRPSGRRVLQHTVEEEETIDRLIQLAGIRWTKKSVRDRARPPADWRSLIYFRSKIHYTDNGSRWNVHISWRKWIWIKIDNW